MISWRNDLKDDLCQEYIGFNTLNLILLIGVCVRLCLCMCMCVCVCVWKGTYIPLAFIDYNTHNISNIAGKHIFNCPIHKVSLSRTNQVFHEINIDS